MIQVKKETERIIKGNNRVFTALIGFNFLSCKVPESIKIKAPNAIRGCIPDQIVFPYLSHIKNRFFEHSEFTSRIFPTPINNHADGFAKQVKKRPYSHIGYIGSLADKDGNVNDTVTLYLPKTDLRQITLRTNPDRIIKEALVTAKTNSGAVLNSYKIKNNEKEKLIFMLETKNADILEITVTKATPEKHIWIVSFYPGFEFLVTEKDIVRIKAQKKKTENKEGSIGRLYINSLDITLNNIDRIYDEKNTKSPIAGYFNSNAVLYAHIFLKQPKNNKPFVLNLGTFFVTEIKNDEAAATVDIKAQDYIGINKSNYVSLGIAENSNAAECFAKIANVLNLSASRVAPELRKIKLDRLPLNGTVGSLLNSLCVLTNAFCSCDETGAGLIAMPMLARHGAVRYPARYFHLNEFKSSNSGENKSISPNVINLSYTTYEYEGEYQVGRRIPLLYKDLPQRTFPEQFKNKSYGEYPVGALEIPSYENTFSIPQGFQTIEFSDPFIPKTLEYLTDYEYDDNGKPKKVTVKIWNFINRNEGEQITIAFMIRAKPIQTLLKKEEFTVPKMPRSYIAPPDDPSFIPNNFQNIENRNKKNKPYEFKIELKDAVKIKKVEIANKYIQRKFEFAYDKNAEGIFVKVWNYFPESPQTVTVNLYGNRLKPSSEKKTITVRNEDDIRRNGEIVKNIEVGALASDDVARDVLASMSYYYRHFSKELSVQTWADPRLLLYDLIAFKSLRGYGFTQGIIDELEIEYKGYLIQKLKIKQTRKHNRDSRVYGSFVLNDRPIIHNSCLEYA